MRPAAHAVAPPAALAEELAAAALVSHGEIQEGNATVVALTEHLCAALNPQDALDEVMIGLAAADLLRLGRLLRCEAVAIGAKAVKSLEQSSIFRQRAAQDTRRERTERIADIRRQLDEAREIAAGEKPRPWSGYVVPDRMQRAALEDELRRLKAAERDAARDARGRALAIPSRSAAVWRSTIAELEAATLETLPECAAAADFVARRRTRYLRGRSPGAYLEELPRNGRGLFRQEALREARRGLEKAEAASRHEQAVEQKLAEAAVPDVSIERRETRLRASLMSALEFVMRRRSGTSRGSGGGVEVRAHRRRPRTC